LIEPSNLRKFVMAALPQPQPPQSPMSLESRLVSAAITGLRSLDPESKTLAFLIPRVLGYQTGEFVA
jgi:hypothetical protein